jgi:hypothetical protein
MVGGVWFLSGLELVKDSVDLRMDILDLLANAWSYCHLLWQPFWAERGVLGQHIPGKR